MRCFHEAPKAIFTHVQERTDGDYALVHLFEEDEAYLAMFKEAVASGREVILDNSIFELGTSFDHDQYAYWIQELQPTWYIVPDVWKDSQATIDMFTEFVGNHKDLPGKVIGVAQGNDLEDVTASYRALEPLCDMVAFNLDFSSYAYANGYVSERCPECIAMAVGRERILTSLADNNVLNPDKPHHLLGCGVPQELTYYDNVTKAYIYSVDTSNPVLHGLENQQYDATGLSFKSSQKMCDLMDVVPTAEQLFDIDFNIRRFKEFMERGY